jgi:hypothetical protein
MQDYEIRIIWPTGAVALVSHCSHLNDSCAIEAAKKLCRDGELAEVWQSDVCIYSECPSRTGALVWPIQGKTALDPETAATQ